MVTGVRLHLNVADRCTWLNRFHSGHYLRADLISFVHALRPSQQVSNYLLTQWLEPELGRELGEYDESLN